MNYDHKLKKCALGLGAFSMSLIFSISAIVWGSLTFQWSLSTLALGVFIASAIMLDYFNREKKAIESEMASKNNPNTVNIVNNVPYQPAQLVQPTQPVQPAQPVQPTQPAILFEQPKRTVTCPKCGGAVVCEEGIEFVACSGCQTRYKNPYFGR